jgi:hypothetical protein
MKTLTRAFVIAIWIMAISYAAHAQTTEGSTVTVISASAVDLDATHGGKQVVVQTSDKHKLRLMCANTDDQGNPNPAGCVLPLAGDVAIIGYIDRTNSITWIVLQYSGKLLAVYGLESSD